MNEVAVAATAGITVHEAKELESRLVKGFEQLEADLARFAETRAWEVLGYTSFWNWWNEKIDSLRVGAAIRPIIFTALAEPDSVTKRAPTTRELAKKVGVDHSTVVRARKVIFGEDAPLSIMNYTNPMLCSEETPSQRITSFKRESEIILGPKFLLSTKDRQRLRTIAESVIKALDTYDPAEHPPVENVEYGLPERIK